MKMNQIFEDELKEAIQFAVEQDYRQLEKDTLGYNHEFSRDFKQKMNDLIGKEKKRIFRRKIRFSILVAVMLLLIGTTVVLANDVIRDKIVNILIEFFDDHVDIKNESGKICDEESFVPYPLKYVPDGFCLEEKEENPINIYFEDYVDEKGNTISYTQSRKDTTLISLTYNGESREKKMLKGISIYYISDGEIETIVFERGAYIYDISTNKNNRILTELFEKNF
ncbi:MAG: DUF4367 domain-containing protein [Lachnospiraceae bacterium]|nr:DUF4367 domain-containing protein [Lachnospiraceae bacterium]